MYVAECLSLLELQACFEKTPNPWYDGTSFLKSNNFLKAAGVFQICLPWTLPLSWPHCSI